LNKNRDFCQKLKLLVKNEIFGENRNFGQKSKLWKNIEISVQKKKILTKKIFLAKISQISAAKVRRKSTT